MAEGGGGLGRGRSVWLREEEDWGEGGVCG